MAQIATPDLDKMLEALRAVRDPSINVQGMTVFLHVRVSRLKSSTEQGQKPESSCAGLEALRQALHGSEGAAILAQLLSRSPDLHELLAVWEAQLTVMTPMLSSCTSAHYARGNWERDDP